MTNTGPRRRAGVYESAEDFRFSRRQQRRRGNAARRRARRRAVPQPRGAAQAARRAGRGDAAPARSPQAAGSRHRPRAGNVRVAREAPRSRRHRTIYPGFLSPARLVGRRARDHRPAGAGSRRQAGRARTQGLGARRQSQDSSSSARRPSSSCARPSRSSSARASSWRRSMRGSRKLDKWWHRWQRPKLARAASGAAGRGRCRGSDAARRAGALRTDREGGRRRISRAFRSKPNARSISLRSPAPKCCACALRALRWWRRRVPPCRGARRPSITATSPPACPS